MWQTLSEKNFIDGLGLHKGYSVDPDPLALLRKYQSALRLRARWDGISREEIEAHVRQRIEELEKEMK